VGTELTTRTGCTPLLLPIDDDQVQPILERLQRWADGLLGIDLLLEVPPAHLDLAADGPFLVVAAGQGAEDLALFLALLERLDEVLGKVRGDRIAIMNRYKYPRHTQ
jgi:hypothetical protein